MEVTDTLVSPANGKRQRAAGPGSEAPADAPSASNSSAEPSNGPPTKKIVVDVDTLSGSSRHVGPSADVPATGAVNTTSPGAMRPKPSVEVEPIIVEQRRLKQPTLAIYGMVSDTAVFRKELADRDAQIEDLREKTTQLEQELERRGTQISFLNTCTEELEAKIKHYQEVLRAEMLDSSKKGQAEARRVLHQQHFELGHIATWPSNGREMWVEGNIMRQIIFELNEANTRREDLEARKKTAQRTLNQLTRHEKDRGEDSAVAPDVSEPLMRAQEELLLLTTELTALNNRIAATRQKKDDLEHEKKAFMKEIRRITDEDSSEFLAVPAIGDGNRYVLMNLLGKGGFSEVWKAFDCVDGQYVACKIHRVSRDWSAQTRGHYLRHAERELEITRQLDHPHLTRLYQVFPLSDSMFVSVMEYSKGTDLDTLLKRCHTLKESDARLVLVQVVSALRHLASLENPIIHYDLKPANVLMHSEDPSVLEIKITDFGLSKIIGSGREGPSDNPSIELTSQGTGTYWYLPPECFDTASTPRISNKVDVWSIGVIFYQMLFGRRPFAEGESQRKIWQEKLIVSSARNLNFPDTPKVSHDAKSLIRHCLSFNVNERYDIFQLSADNYISKRTSTTKHKDRSGSTASMVAPAMGAPTTRRQREP
ncbi:tousled-like kinase [Strigomonas culicis]|uniref:Tousled-like kinase n=1 Tax=Strigomonas culicis TaxID=28005 RepID=S9VUZ3_9TRYP|nr:tousled-like kinase [Strigomonas culicis]|eukprot:EPY30996.1 tousled-like kinase [Strigomonas culicis]